MSNRRSAGATAGLALTLIFTVALTLSCASAGGFNATLSQHMYVHSSQVGALRSALVHGNLEAARSAAAWMADHPDHPDLPRGVKSPMDEIRSLAREVEAAPDLEEASMSAAAMGAACGRCHLATEDGPDYRITSMPPSVTDFESDMQLHVWATERMWEGLIMPSERVWEAGASALIGAPLYPADTEDGASVQDLARQVEGLAREAVRVDESDRYAGLYGRLLGTCATCHQLLDASEP